MKSKVFVWTMIGCLMLACFSLTGPMSHAYAKSPDNQVSTINWIDAHGKIVKTWHGSKAEANRIEKAEQAAQLKLLQGATQHDTVPFINRVNNCIFPNDFFDIFNQGVVCFANQGFVDVEIFSVFEVSSGNNHGQFSIVPCGNNNCGPLITIHIGYNTTDFPANHGLWTVLSVFIYPA